MSLVDVFNESWSWTGFTASRVRAQSPMGHLILSDAEENFVYLDTDGLSLIPLGSREEAEAHLAQEEAQDLWWGGDLIANAREKLGEPPEGSVFSLTPAALIEGRYELENIWIISLEELIAFTGQAARQLKDVPDGAQIIIEVTD
ncbi:MAG: T6SS immunity protein Tdi1 domain-containing protein [Pseudomonadota bacterium]